MIAIVDYGLGNIQAFANIYNRLDIAVKFAKSADDLEGATHIILPGVGAFDWAMECLDASGMRATLDRLVIEERKPVLGICVGMQIMAMRSEEGRADGLAWFDAVVKRFEEPALQKLHREVRAAMLSAEVKDLDYVGVLQRRDRRGLPQK